VSFTATAWDPENDNVSFAPVGSLPQGAALTAGGIFNWTPTWQQLGSHTITIRVTDDGGLSDTRSCIITVGNEPPVLNELADLDAHPGQPVTFTATAWDPENDNVSFAPVGSLPQGATLTAGGIFNWTPTWQQLGSHTITIRVTDDGGLSDTRSCIITVSNQPPVMNPLPDQEAEAGQQFGFTATAWDPENDPLTFSAVGNLPQGATLTAGGDFSWTPNQNQVGSHAVTIRATDQGGLSDVASCIVTVVAGQAMQMNMKGQQKKKKAKSS
jgi:hypothetical protein